MKVGIFSILPDQEADPAIVAKHAEDLGFSSYWVPDHIMLPVEYSTSYPGNTGDGPDPDYLWQMPDPLVALTRAATVTTSLEVGTAVLLVPERHPVHLAKEIASLDSYSDGRFHFGIGAGWNKEESEILGGDFDRRWSQVKEAITAMRACWECDESSHSGKYYQFPPIKSFPKPAQKPSPPVYLPSIMFEGQWSARVFKRIVEWGEGWLPVVESPGQLKTGLDRLSELYEQAEKSNRCRVRVLGAEGQWRHREALAQFAELGIEEVIIWLTERKSSEIQKELDLLSKDVL